MPRLLAPSHQLRSLSGSWKRRREDAETAREQGVNAPSRSLTSKQMERSSHALAQMWWRLQKSFHTTAYHHDAAATTPTAALLRDASATGAAPDGDGDVSQLNGLWQRGFNTCGTSEDLIFHLIVNTEFFDRLSWLVAFCLLTRVELRQQIDARVRCYAQITAMLPAHAIASSSPASQPTSSALPTVPATSECVGDEYQTLFTAYCLAVKGQCDYNVTVRYLVDLLPHSKSTRKLIAETTIHREAALFAALDFNAGVTPAEVVSLVQQYGTPSDRTWIADLLPRLADGTEAQLRRCLAPP